MGRDPTPLHRHHHRGHASVYPQLVVNARQVRFDRALADAQAHGDLLAALALRHAAQHFHSRSVSGVWGRAPAGSRRRGPRGLDSSRAMTLGLSSVSPRAAARMALNKRLAVGIFQQVTPRPAASRASSAHLR